MKHSSDMLLVSVANLRDQLEHERNVCEELIHPEKKLHITCIPIGMSPIKQQ